MKRVKVLREVIRMKGLNRGEGSEGGEGINREYRVGGG